MIYKQEKNTAPLFSVIVPIYNAERYLKKCIDSILNQTRQNFELILVDDGSTDSSERICREYACQGGRIHYIKKQNAGVSAARNTGIEAAKGKYLLFCDSDDFWNSMLLEVLTPYAEQGCYDILHFGHSVDCYEKETRIASLTRSLPQDIVLESNQWKQHFRYYWNSDIGKLACWDKAFKRQMVLQWKIRYPVGQMILEDFCFTLQGWRHAKKILVLHDILYHFRKDMNDSGFSKRPQADIFKDTESVLHHWEAFLKQYGIQQADAPEAYCFCCESYQNILQFLQQNGASVTVTAQTLKKMYASKRFLHHNPYHTGKKIRILDKLCRHQLYWLAAIFWKR